MMVILYIIGFLIAMTILGVGLLGMIALLKWVAEKFGLDPWNTSW